MQIRSSEANTVRRLAVKHRTSMVALINQAVAHYEEHSTHEPPQRTPELMELELFLRTLRTILTDRQPWENLAMFLMAHERDLERHHVYIRGMLYGL